MLNAPDALVTPCPDWCGREHRGDSWWDCSHTSPPIASEGLPVQVRIMQLDERREDDSLIIGSPSPVLWNVESHCEVIDIDGPVQLMQLAEALTKAAEALLLTQL